MNGQFNLKAIVKLLKFAGKYRRVFWAKENGCWYVSTGEWAIRFDGELPRELLVVLFSIFLRTPSTGECLQVVRGDEATVTGNPLLQVFERFSKSTNKGKITAFCQDISDDVKARVMDFGSYYVRVNEEFVKILNGGIGKEVVSQSVMEPVFLLDGAVILLPYRVTSDAERPLLDELLKGA